MLVTVITLVKLLLAFAMADQAPEVRVSTHVYARSAEGALELDVHRASEAAFLPAVIFVHGGGFYTGTRKEANILHFCDSLAQGGVLAVNIAYRLALKGRSFSCKEPVADKIAAIATAADDVRQATRWLIDHADSLGIDPARIFVAGSSSGAEAVFHAVYFDHRADGAPCTALPDGFRYRAMMAFAGAVLDTSVITAHTAIPTLLYHGNCDALVPYGSALHHYCSPEAPGAMMLHGSWTVCNRLEALGTSVRLVTSCGGKHGSAVTPIERNIADVLYFIHRADAGVPFNEHEVRNDFSHQCPQFGAWPHCDQ